MNTSSWPRERYELRQYFNGLGPRVLCMLDLDIGFMTKWTVYQVRTFPSWISENNVFVLIGKNAHAMAYCFSIGVRVSIKDTALPLLLWIWICTHLGIVTCHRQIQRRNFRRWGSPEFRRSEMQACMLERCCIYHLGKGSALIDGAMSEVQKGDPFLRWTTQDITNAKTRQDCNGYLVDSDISRYTDRIGWTSYCQWRSEII